MTCKHGEIGRNDPCPCGSGHKFKKCNVQKCSSPSLRKFKATVIPGATSLFNKALPSKEVVSSSSGLTTVDLAKRIRSAEIK